MALIAYLYVNDTPIGWIAATRTAPGRDGGLPGPDEVHTYDVEAVVNGQHRHGTTAHRYGDGVTSLVAKAAEAVTTR